MWILVTVIDMVSYKSGCSVQGGRDVCTALGGSDSKWELHDLLSETQWGK